MSHFEALYEFSQWKNTDFCLINHMERKIWKKNRFAELSKCDVDFCYVKKSSFGGGGLSNINVWWQGEEGVKNFKNWWRLYECRLLESLNVPIWTELFRRPNWAKLSLRPNWAIFWSTLRIIICENEYIRLYSLHKIDWWRS